MVGLWSDFWAYHQFTRHHDRSHNHSHNHNEVCEPQSHNHGQNHNGHHKAWKHDYDYDYNVVRTKQVKVWVILVTLPNQLCSSF